MFSLDPFAFKQFDPLFQGSPKILSCTKDEFVKQVNHIFEEKKLELKEGYAPFCKHVFVENFTDAAGFVNIFLNNCLVNYLEITNENSSLLMTEYQARRPEELAVLARYFPKSKFSSMPKAKYLDIILYSREQIINENKSMGKTGEEAEYDADIPWGIVCCIASIFYNY